MRVVIQWALRFILLIWWLVIAFVVIQFYLDNNTVTVSLKVVRWTIDDLMLSQLVLGVLVGSLLMAAAMLAPWIWLLRMKNARLKRRLNKVQSSLDALTKVDS